MKKMKNKTYFITLTPRQLFFFGSEQGEKADYYLRGSFIPQQTALLGLIRHQILIQNNLLNDNKIADDDTAAIWIGAKSFEWDKDNKFGKIISLGPCHLVKDVGDQKKYLPGLPSFIAGIQKIGDNYFLPKYDPKKHYPTLWKETDGDGTVVESDCYDEIERIGVDKNYSGKTENDSFFKQIWLKMRKNYSFGFYLTISEDVILNNADVTFGKESSSFVMTVNEIQSVPAENPNNFNAILLVSDAFTSNKFIDYADFAVCDTVPFRNIVNSTSRNHRYYSSHKSPFRLQLIKKGSVFIANSDNLIQLKNELDTYTNFKRIGYNHFKQIKIES